MAFVLVSFRGVCVCVCVCVRERERERYLCCTGPLLSFSVQRERVGALSMLYSIAYPTVLIIDSSPKRIPASARRKEV